MQMINFKNAFNTELLSKIVELNKNYALLKNIIEEENKFDPKYKTELCKKFQSTGQCPYGYKCRFAHGKEELITKSQGVNYKKKPCKTFNDKGYCPYGSRCSFRHDERKFSETNFSYFYLQLFLFKKYNFLPSRKNFYSEKSNLLTDRLDIFKTITKNCLNESNQQDLFNDKFNNETQDRNNSFSTISNTSNEDSDQKKGIQNDLYLGANIKNNEEFNLYKDKLSYNQHNKENISGNIKN
jgi:hypothetical protein